MDKQNIYPISEASPESFCDYMAPKSRRGVESGGKLFRKTLNWLQNQEVFFCETTLVCRHCKEKKNISSAPVEDKRSLKKKIKKGAFSCC